jgi:hypothetical protein
MNRPVNRIWIGALWIAGALSVWAQDDPRGHWSGSVEVPNQTLAMEVDLDQGPKGWIGSSAERIGHSTRGDYVHEREVHFPR